MIEGIGVFDIVKSGWPVLLFSEVMGQSFSNDIVEWMLRKEKCEPMSDDQNSSLGFLEAIRSLSNVDPYGINDRVYKEQNVTLDGYHFKNCAFITCNIIVGIGNFSLNKCYFHNCTLYFTDNAQRVVKMVSTFTGIDLPENLRAKMDADKAVTVL